MPQRYISSNSECVEEVHIVFSSERDQNFFLKKLGK